MISLKHKRSKLSVMDDFMLQSDLEYAYDLQLEEALAASLKSQRPPPSSAPEDIMSNASFVSGESSSSSLRRRQDIKPPKRGVELRIGRLKPDDIAELEQMFVDGLQFQFGMHDTYGESSLGIRNLNSERDFSDDEWGKYFNKPGVDNQDVFRLYFKGLLSEEAVGNQRRNLGGIGIAICDSKDELVLQMSKPLIGNEMNKRIAEAKALIEGLNAALELKLKRVTFHCDYYPIFQFVTGRWRPKQLNLTKLINQIDSLRGRFESCKPWLVARHDIKFAFKFARDAIESQISRVEYPPQNKKLNETCVICLEDCDVKRIFSVDGCMHRYCISCMKQHVEVKLLQGMFPKCPHENCKVDLNVDSCAKFLTHKDIATMRQRVKEASIPVSEKVYCPYPKCSVLMSKGEVLSYTKDVLGDANQFGVRKCKKCHGLFCIDCKVPWHSNISCSDYKKLHKPLSEDVKLKSLASRNLWRQCVKCNHMIELAEGCYHMTCRCGYEFCYNCGAERKNKTNTCSCPLWDENLIWYGDDDVDVVDDDDVFNGMFFDYGEEIYVSDDDDYYF